MTDKKRHIRLDLEKVKPGGFAVIGIIVTTMIAVVIASVLEHIKTGTEIDPEKDVYLFLHGRTDLQEKAETALVAYGFPKEKIIKASSEKVGKAGDYMAMLWRPINAYKGRKQNIRINSAYPTVCLAGLPDVFFGGRLEDFNIIHQLFCP